MNSIDVTILIILLFFAAKGFFRGFIMEAFTLIGMVLAYIIALREMSSLAGAMSKAVRAPEWVVTALSFFIIFLVVVIFFRLMAGALRKLTRWTFIGGVDRIGGIAFGIFKGALVASLLALLISLIPVPDDVKATEDESYLFKPVRSVAPAVFNVIKKAVPKSKDFYDEVKETFANTTETVKDHVVSKHLEDVQKELEEKLK